MNRTDFIRSYAARSNLSDEWAVLGFIEVGDRYLIALPCGCADETCEGWAMLPPSGVLDHFQMYAPEKLREAYNEAVREADGKT